MLMMCDDDNLMTIDMIELMMMMMSSYKYNLINFSIIACGARCASSCTTAHLLTGAQPVLDLGIFFYMHWCM